MEVAVRRCVIVLAYPTDVAPLLAKRVVEEHWKLQREE